MSLFPNLSNLSNLSHLSSLPISMNPMDMTDSGVGNSMDSALWRLIEQVETFSLRPFSTEDTRPEVSQARSWMLAFKAKVVYEFFEANHNYEKLKSVKEYIQEMRMTSFDVAMNREISYYVQRKDELLGVLVQLEAELERQVRKEEEEKAAAEAAAAAAAAAASSSSSSSAPSAHNDHASFEEKWRALQAEFRRKLDRLKQFKPLEDLTEVSALEKQKKMFNIVSKCISSIRESDMYRTLDFFLGPTMKKDALSFSIQEIMGLEIMFYRGLDTFSSENNRLAAYKDEILAVMREMEKKIDELIAHLETKYTPIHKRSAPDSTEPSRRQRIAAAAFVS